MNSWFVLTYLGIGKSILKSRTLISPSPIGIKLLTKHVSLYPFQTFPCIEIFIFFLKLKRSGCKIQPMISHLIFHWHGKLR